MPKTKKTCPYCGKELISTSDPKYNDNYYRGCYCNGTQTARIDPYAAEIYNDYSLVIMCDGEEYESSMDI